ncbi:MAG: hypothetical protein J2P29_08590 [Actinobacteria bacterium]|nr:hypothetical protein [Actinomycetota bacterium]MBO0832011.1 hypothetical protein [Actinomycetota bacterium]
MRYELAQVNIARLPGLTSAHTFAGDIELWKPDRGYPSPPPAPEPMREP